MSAAPRFTTLLCVECHRGEQPPDWPAARFSLCTDGQWRCNPCALAWTRAQGGQP